MFNFFKKKKKAPEPLKCNCGSWPDPTWKQEDFLNKHDKVKVCPVHKDLKMVMMVTGNVSVNNPVPPAPQKLVTGGVLSPIQEGMMTAEEALGIELRSARIHLLECTTLVSARTVLWNELNELIEWIEDVIEREKPS